MANQSEKAQVTATGPSDVVLLEQTFPQGQRIIDDDVSVKMSTGSNRFWYNLCQLRFMRNFFFWFYEKITPGIWAMFTGRKRYIQDRAHEHLERGAQQVVSLGAGFDTLLSRDSALVNLPCFEVDLPGNTQTKREALTRALGSVPKNLTLVAVDFEKDDLAEKLEESGFDKTKVTCFIWEAVTQYLEEGAVRATFDFLKTAEPGSRVVFTYVQKAYLEGKEDFGMGLLRKQVLGEKPLWVFGLRPGEVEGFVEPYGFKVLSNIGSAEFDAQYTEGLGRSFLFTNIEPIAVVERT